MKGQGNESRWGEIFLIRPDRPSGLPSLLYNGYRVFSGGKAVGAWRWPPTPSSDEVKERVELYLCFPYGPSWPVLGWPLPVPLPLSVFFFPWIAKWITVTKFYVEIIFGTLKTNTMSLVVTCFVVLSNFLSTTEPMRHQREVLGYKQLQCQIKPWNRVLTEQTYPRCPWHCVMLPADTFCIRQRPLFHALAKAKNNASKQFRPFFGYIVKGNLNQNDIPRLPYR